MTESLEVKQFTLGNQTPFIKCVRAFDMISGKCIPISAFTLTNPASSLTLSLHHQVGLRADIQLDSDDFRMVFGTRLFGKE